MEANPFKDFIIRLVAQMATGNFIVGVAIGNGVVVTADVLGYDEEYWNVKVKFHSDELQKPSRVEDESVVWGLERESPTVYKTVMVPVKIENVSYDFIKLEGDE